MTSPDLFTGYVPASAASYCRHLWQLYAFALKVVQPRQTRLGDFRVLPDRQLQITINADLNPYAFLITYVHEVAHAAVWHSWVGKRTKQRPKPHGPVWQMAFQELMQPLLTDQIFPVAILSALRTYMKRPAATTHASPPLMQALRQANEPVSEQVVTDQPLLHDLPEGQTFCFRNKLYVRGALRRTRVVCKEVSTGKLYAILAYASVNTTG